LELAEMYTLLLQTGAAIIPIVMAISLLVAMGWWLSSSLLNQDQKQWLNQCVSRFLMPIWLFANAASADLLTLSNADFVISYFLAALVLIFFILLLVKRQIAAIVLAAIYSNTVYFSLPIIELVLDGNAINYALSIIVINTFFVLLSFEIIKYVSTDGQQIARINTFKKILITILRNPIVMSLLLGVAVNLGLGGALESMAIYRDYSTLPILSVALISLGVSLHSLPKQAQRSPWLAVGLKLLVFPILVFCCARFMFDLANDVIYVLVVLAASPLAINSYFFVNGDRTSERFIGRCIVMTSFASVVSMPLWIVMLNLLLSDYIYK